MKSGNSPGWKNPFSEDSKSKNEIPIIMLAPIIITEIMKAK